ncbi:LCP family protein [Nocardioides sp. YIM 152315]|uniref:LCP family protein n=1 Tax=Nocardioides sp. YIM 152315 TaxID=3031760 RepID=UPI0023DCC556|nr:LCP family protein [Nocardioides sp. YIM 152315]MDF1602433.1 LCP family protein [Nocardioides sp. YIM 152315]
MTLTVGPPAPADHPGGARTSGGAGRHRAAKARRFRRTRTLAGALGVTLLGAVLPGAGYLWSRRRLGYVVLVPFLVGLAAAAYYVGDLSRAVDLAFDPTRLRVARFALGAVLAAWVFVVATTYLMVRPLGMARVEKALGVLVVSLLCVLGAIPAVQAVRIADSQADLVATVFDNEKTATAPNDVTKADPWGGRDRVNVLLLGGDGGVGRTGIRTDSVILLSMDTHKGKAVMFSLPRNMMNAQFPEDSPLHDVFPDGFRGEGDPGSWMLNAIYGQVPALYPKVLGKSENEGADAIKEAVAGSLGTHVDYYVLINLLGFQQLVDAIGGVTVNINEPIAINGNTDAGIPPTGYLEPGPDQHLNGFHALWYSRGRWGSDDYERMLRQRCMVSAIVDAADPLNVLRRYQDLAKAGKEILRTDVPRDLMPAFVDLALKVKEKKMRSIAFVSSERFYSADPDFEWMRSVVDKALGPKGKGGEKDDPGKAVKTSDACGYHPEG